MSDTSGTSTPPAPGGAFGFPGGPQGPQTRPPDPDVDRSEPPVTDEDAQTAAVAEDVQATVDRETEQGHIGEAVDPTPNENYTLEGVTSDAPTPETDPAYAAEVDAHLRERARRSTDPARAKAEDARRGDR